MKMDTRKPSLREMMNSESKNSMKNDLKVRIVTQTHLEFVSFIFNENCREQNVLAVMFNFELLEVI